jgi:hypothetical protein
VPDSLSTVDWIEAEMAQLTGDEHAVAPRRHSSPRVDREEEWAEGGGGKRRRHETLGAVVAVAAWVRGGGDDPG